MFLGLTECGPFPESGETGSATNAEALAMATRIAVKCIALVFEALDLSIDVLWNEKIGWKEMELRQCKFNSY